MSRFPYFARAVLVGLLTTQIIATLHVYLSNVNLYETLSAIMEAGYLPIPNQRIVHTLKEFVPAFCGGIFFTLSLGAGLSILAVICAWIWDRIGARRRAFLVPIIILWLGILISVNSQGFCSMASSYFLVTPLVVFMFTLKWMPKQKGKRTWLNWCTHIAPIAMLTVIWSVYAVWSSRAEQDLFLHIRDHLLLSNPIGQKVDQFYYRYTLYPAQAFKTLEQKLLKTCALGAMRDKTVTRRMERVLTSHDYLPVSTNLPVDLEIVESENAMIFKHKGKRILQSSSKEFFSRPKNVLGRFSAEVDKQAPFRQATFLSLLVGFPLLLYIMVFTLLRYVFGFFLGTMSSSLTAGVLCFAIGLALLAPPFIGHLKTVNDISLSKALDSDSWEQRVAALRTVIRERRQIRHAPAYRKILASPHIPERYWLAKALGMSKNRETYGDLLALLNDPHPNVVSVAFQALGQRGERRAVNEILRRIELSDHWYNQWYAYKALRKLGWNQTVVRSLSQNS